VSVQVSGFAVHVPGASPGQLPGAVTDAAEMCPAAEAKTLLGRKGTLYKEPSTLLALCAVQRALKLPAGRPVAPIAGAAGTAVVVSSNLGNADTVCDITARVDAASCREVSPMEAPNASSNVIAGAIAIRFGFTGPNFTVCNGATSGIDAIRLGARLIRAGRAERVVVAGVEPADPTTELLIKQRDPAAFDGLEPPAPREAAACVVLRHAPAGSPQPGPVRIGRSGVIPPGDPAEALSEVVGQVLDGPGSLLFAPYGVAPAGPYDVVDLTECLGETYGALGVLQTACAVARRPRRALAVSGDRVDGYSWLELEVG
jgi:3-oxoacyl-[acyl-carrier-protein] synthase II